MHHRLRIRRFLNLPGYHAGAYVVAYVPDSSFCPEGDPHSWCCEPILRISDCGRVISLEFDLDAPQEVRNSLHKIDVLVDALTRFRAAIEAEAEARASARKKRSKARVR